MENYQDILMKILQKADKIEDTQNVILQLQNDVRAMRGEVRGMCGTVAQISAEICETRGEIEKSRGNMGQIHLRMDRMQQELAEVKQLAAHAIQSVESGIADKLRKIEENQASILDERRVLMKLMKDAESLESELWTLKIVTKEHTKAIQKLQAALNSRDSASKN